MRVRIRKVPSVHQNIQYWRVECKHWWNLTWEYYESICDEKEAIRCAQELSNPLIVEFYRGEAA